MQYIALNGFRHPLNRYFNDKVQCVNEFDWNNKTIHKLNALIKTPTILIGFSDGATAALHISAINPNIQVVYAHSPMIPDILPTRPKSYVTLFRTRGDTTPTYRATLRIHELLAHKITSCIIYTINPLPPLPIRDFATLVMAWKKHQFHNCLFCLPEEIINETFH